MLNNNSSGFKLVKWKLSPFTKLQYTINYYWFLFVAVHLNICIVNAIEYTDYVRLCMSKFIRHLSPGPGPGRYGLPPTIGFVGHDFTKPTSPAYSFHGRISNNSEWHQDYRCSMSLNFFTCSKTCEKRFWFSNIFTQKKRKKKIKV